MKETDDIILEYLDDVYPSAVPPAVIHWNIHNRSEEYDLESRVRGGSFTKTTLGNRIGRLGEADLVKKVNQKAGYRKITDDGRAYLRGELDVSESDE